MPLDFRPRWRYVVNKAGAANAAPALKYKFYFTPLFGGYTEFGIVPMIEIWRLQDAVFYENISKSDYIRDNLKNVTTCAIMETL